jgi:hypothetical protein
MEAVDHSGVAQLANAPKLTNLKSRSTIHWGEKTHPRNFHIRGGVYQTQRTAGDELLTLMARLTLLLTAIHLIPSGEGVDYRPNKNSVGNPSSSEEFLPEESSAPCRESNSEEGESKKERE